MPPARNLVPAAPSFSRRDWMTFGALAILACLIFAGFKYAVNVSAYNAGHAAYQQGDCAAVTASYLKMDVDDSENAAFLSPEVNTIRANELRECRTFMKSAFKWESNGTFNTPRKAGDALVAYMEFARDYPDTPVRPVANMRIAELFRDTTPAELAQTLNLCEALLLDVDNFVQGVDSEKVLPDLLAECGLMYRALDLHSDALFCNENNISGLRRTNDCTDEEKTLNRSVGAVQYFNAFLARFPNHKRKTEVEGLLIDELNVQVDVFDTAALPQPDIIGFNDGDKATVIIQNDGPAATQLAFNNELHVIEKCATCRTYTQQEADEA